MQFKCTICCKQGDFWQDLECIRVTKSGHIIHLNCLKTHTSSQPKSIIDCPMSTCNKKIKQSTIIQIDPLVIEKRKESKQIYKPIDCTLCNSAVEDPKNISVTKCGHLHHYDCLTEFVRPKSYPCLVPSCKKKITKSSITQIHLQDPTEEELRALVVEMDDPFEPKKETKTEDSPSISSKKLTQTANITQKYCVQDKKCDIKPESSQAHSSDQLLPLLLLNKKVLCGQKNEQLSQQIKLDLERECLMHVLDEQPKPKNEISENQEILELQQENTVLMEKVETLDKERNDAKKETAIWEMSFKYLQDNFENTELMIPNEKTLQLIKENEKLKMDIQEMEKKRDDAKKDTKIWELSYSYLQETFKDTDLMIPDETTLNIVKENANLKICINDLGRDLVSAKKDVNSAQYLRADLENYIEENLNLKNENEKMKRDLKTVREEMIKLDSTVTDMVVRHSHENETLNELNHSLLKENTRLNKMNETLQSEKNKLNKLNETLQSEKNKLNELNETLTNEINKLKELSNTLQEGIKKLTEGNDSLLKENNDLHELNETLLNENNTLNVLNTSLQEDNQEFNKSNPALLNKLLGENARLNELNETLKNDNNNLEKLNESLQKEKNKSNELVLSLQKEKRDFQWEVISRRHSNSDGFRVANKRRASEIDCTASEKNANINRGNEESVKKEVVNRKGVINEAVSERAVKQEVVSEEAVNDNDVNKEANRGNEEKEVVNKKGVKNEVVSEKAVEQEVVSEEAVNENDVNKEAKNEKPVIKKMKLENEDGTDDCASVSGS